MGFVHPAKTDLFVSYAHVDDRPLESESRGWVTTLVKNLEILLAQKLGRAESISLWMDHRLPGHVELTPEIESKLGEAAALLIVLSPAYLASTWCIKEMSFFSKAIRRSGGRVGARIFVVEYDQVERPQDLVDLKGYRFWAKDPLGRSTRTLGIPRPVPEDRGYYDQLCDLQHDLADALTRRKADADDVPIPHGEGDRPVVFLAEVTDDLEDQREEVRRYLDQAGLTVVPEGNYFRAAVEGDLARAKLFVQLLSGLAGKRLPGESQTIVGLQHECALGRGIPILQWHARGLDLATVARPDHRALLEGPSVIAADLPEFKSLVVQKVRELTAPKPAAPRVDKDADTLVFVNAEEADLDLANRIGSLLFRCGIGYVIPKRSRRPAEARKALEEYLLNCDGLVLVHGTNPDWVLEQVIRFRKIKPRRKFPIKAIGICDGPPPEKEECHFGLPGLRVIDCRHGLDEDGLNQFADNFI
jgi:TIR domain